MEDEDTRAVCSLSLRFFSLTAADLIRTHGPVVNRCSGSLRPPGPELSVSPSLLVSSHSACIGTAQLASGPSQASSSAPLPDPCSIQPFLAPVRILKRIPSTSRELAGTKLATILGGVAGNNDLDTWERLFHFSVHCLRVPTRCGRNWSLATMVNSKLRDPLAFFGPLGV